MKILTLDCQHCGAPLEVPAKIRALTCTYCGTRLQVQQEGAAAWTETLEDLREDVRYLRRKADLADLDREWEAERERYLVKGKHGQTSAPSTGSGAASIVIALIFGGFWTTFAMGIAQGSPGPAALFPLFGILFIIIGVVSGVRQISKAQSLEEARTRYRSRRAELLGD